MKIKPRRKLVYPADELSASENIQGSLQGAVDTLEGSDNGAHLQGSLQGDDATFETNETTGTGNGAHDAESSDGAGNGLTSGNGSAKIMLPKRRRVVTQSTAMAVAPIVAEPEVEDTVAAPVAPRLPSKRKAAKAVVAAGAVSEPAPTPIPEPPPVRAPRPKLFAEDGLRVYLTYENLFWVGLLVFTIATRFWDLAPRGIHHDESLHAHFSRQLYDGTGYMHDPMMHGPLQFHLIAFMYWLFGVTDATARFASVFCGIFVVMSPFFLRRQMGRIPAMVCAFLLFISPSILYFSRMAREDAIFSGMEMIMLVGLWRFVSDRKPTDFVIFMAGLALMFTIKETAYLTVLVLAVLGLVLFAIQAGYAFMAALGVYGGAAGLLYYFVNNGMKDGTIAHLPDIPQVSPNFDIIWQFMGAFFGHPLVYGLLILTAIFLVGVTVMMRSQRRNAPAPSEPIAASVPTRKVQSSNGVATRPIAGTEAEVSGNGREPAAVVASVESDATPAVTEPSDDASPLYDPSEMTPSQGSATGRYQPGSMPHLIGSLFSRPSVLVVGLGVAAAIYITLYTVFFTDIPRGIISGPFGSLGYWMAQHDVVRGDQPWYYYSLLIPLYEPVAIFFSLAAIVFFTWRGARWAFRRMRGEVEPGEPYPQRFGWFNTERTLPFATFTSFLPLFLIVWLLGVFSIYSWAGEKMPWLMMHMVRPAIFLASLFIGALIVSLIKKRRERIAEAEVYTPEYAPEPLSPLPTRRHSPAMQSRAMDEGRRWGRFSPVGGNLALAGATASGTPPQIIAMSNGYGRDIPPPPPRKRGTGKAVDEPQPVQKQEPPWVTWSKPGSLFPFISYMIIFIVMTLAWGLKMNALTYFSKLGDWGLTWIFPLIIALATIGYAIWIGPKRALKYLGLGILAVGLMYQFRSSVNLSYNNPDVPTEMAVYVQTSPHVVSTIRNLEKLADLTPSTLSYPAGPQGGPKKGLKVIYDSFTSWPMEWYLRDFDKQFIGAGEATPGADVPVLLLEYAKHNSKENLIADYQSIRYPMRWWFPEEWYKEEFVPNRWARDANGNTMTAPTTNKRIESPILEQVGGALGTIRGTVMEPQMQSTLWKYLTFREPPKPLGSEDMLLFVRKDLAQTWHRLQYNPPPPSTDVEPRALPEKEWWLTDPKTGQ